MPRAVAERYVHKTFAHSSHRLLVDLVGEKPVRVLDVGAATGFLGRELTARGHWVVGLEVDAQAAAQARPHYVAFHVGELHAGLSLPEAPFDVVVAGDVLEHVVDASAVLRRLVAHLAGDGRVLISVPNVAFLPVRLALLAGRFDYSDRGILDRTHVSFFTRRTLQELVQGAGLRTLKLVGLPPPLPLLWPAFARWPLRAAFVLAALAARLRPTLFAYQLVVEASPHSVHPSGTANRSTPPTV